MGFICDIPSCMMRQISSATLCFFWILSGVVSAQNILTNMQNEHEPSNRKTEHRWNLSKACMHAAGKKHALREQITVAENVVRN